MNIFERASRAKLRFESGKGQLSTEDLWTLSLTSLDSIAKSVNKKIKDQGEESFIEEKSNEDTEEVLRLDILKHVINSKKTSIEAAKKASETKAQIEQLQNLLLVKKTEELSKLSPAEIEEKLNALKA